MIALHVVAFLCFGAVIVLVGATQDALVLALGLDVAQTGLLGAMLAVGAGVGIGGAGPLCDRFPRRPLFVAAAALAATALLTVHRDMGYAGVLVRVLVLGVGAGAYNTLVNTTLSDRYGDRSVRPMALVHSGATVGASLGAPLLGWVADAHHWTASFRLLGALHVGVALLASAVALPANRHRRQESAGAAPPAAHATLAPYLVVAFAYVAMEAGATNFAVPYATDALSLPADRGRLAMSALWVGILGGRLLLFGSGRFGVRALLVSGVGSALVIGLGVGLAVPAVEAMFFGLGLSIGCVYPLDMALIGERFPRWRGTAMGLAGASGACGGFLAPFALGQLGVRFGVGPAMLGLAGFGALLALAAFSALRRSRPATIAVGSG